MNYIAPVFSGWAIAMRFSKKEYLEGFRKGELFTRPLEQFAKIERRDAQRYDRFEGSEQIVQPKDVKHLTIRDNVTGKEIIATAADLAGPVMISTGREVDCNVFCMFSVTQPVPKPFCDPRNFDFGGSFVIVTDTQQFLNRVKAACDRAGLGFRCGLVGYFDEDEYTGKTGPFSKPKAFAHQREFRIAIQPGSKDVFRLDVGSLEDITTPIHPLSDINEMCDFGPEAAQLAGIPW